MLLGEMLADRAYKNLPIFYRETAIEWANSPGRQDPMLEQIIYDMMMDQFTNSKWRKLRGLSRKDDPPSSEVLPAALQSWTRGQEQPNCLGLAQMLVGFARATGRRHLLVNTVRTHHNTMNGRLYRALEWLMEQLEPFSAHHGIAREISIAKGWHKVSFEVATEEYDDRAHHALMIESGNRWVVLDPYLNRNYRIRFAPRFHDLVWERTERTPRRHYSLSSNEVPHRIVRLQQAVVLAKEAIYELEATGRPVDIDALAQDIVIKLYIGIAKAGPTDEKLFSDLFTEVDSALAGSRHFFRTINKLAEDQRKPYYETVRNRLHTSVYHQRFALKRLLAAVSRRYMLGLGDISEDPFVEHPLIEMQHASLHLAVMTLNHYGGRQGVSTADLLRFSHSQFIIRDALADVKKGDSKLHKAVLATRLNGLRRMNSSMVMPDLRAHLT
jgi:hypothetical protein